MLASLCLCVLVRVCACSCPYGFLLCRYYKYTDSTNTTLEYASGALRVESTWFYPQPAALYMPDPAADEATNVAQVWES